MNVLNITGILLNVLNKMPVEIKIENTKDLA